MNVLFPDGLAIGMEDIGVSEEVDNQEDENGAISEDDDADLCYEKHTGKYWDLSVQHWYVIHFTIVMIKYKQLLAESVQWIFKISPCDVISADYTIIMSRTLKVTDNHVNFSALCCLPSVKKQKHDFHFFRSMYNKTIIIIRLGFCDIQNNQGRGRGCELKPRAEADNPYRNLDYSGYHRNQV